MQYGENFYNKKSKNIDHNQKNKKGTCVVKIWESGYAWTILPSFYTKVCNKFYMVLFFWTLRLLHIIYDVPIFCGCAGANGKFVDLFNFRSGFKSWFLSEAVFKNLKLNL